MRRFLVLVAQRIAGLALSFPTLTYWLKPLLKSNPWMWEILKKHILFRQLESGHEDAFISLHLKSVEVRFSRGPLNDRRGIGRVAKELLAQLQASQQEDDRLGRSGGDGTAQVVHFYCSVHWCPDILPPRSVVMIHDVIPLLFPEKFPKAVVREWTTRYAKIARQADLLFTISDASKAAISTHLGVPQARIRVVRNGVTPLPVSPERRVELPTVPYAVYLGSDDFHKNVDVVFSAMCSPLLRELSLVMIGDNKSARRRVRALGLTQRVHFMGSLEDADVGYVLSEAMALVCPSLYEGFGLPPLEAAVFGVPAVCSRRPAMTELLEGAALFASPDSPDEWTNCLARLLKDSNFRDVVGQLAQQRAQSLTWEVASKALSDELHAFARAETRVLSAPL